MPRPGFSFLVCPDSRLFQTLKRFSVACTFCYSSLHLFAGSIERVNHRLHAGTRIAALADTLQHCSKHIVERRNIQILPITDCLGGANIAAAIQCAR